VRRRCELRRILHRLHRSGETLIRDSDSLALQPLGPLDLAVAAAVHAGCFDAAWNQAAMGQILAMPGSFGALALVGDQPAGLVLSLAVAPDAEILTLGVLPRFRRRGIAGRLLAWVTDRSIGAGCQRLLLEVAEDNTSARAFYRRLDFAEIGRRPAYYQQSASAAAAIVLARTLGSRET